MLMVGKDESRPYICEGGDKGKKIGIKRIGSIVLIGAIVLILVLSAISIVNPDSKTSPTKYTYVSRGPILINDDAAFNLTNGVTGGSGTLADPYKINNWDIQASTAHAIEILNTSAYFVIRNCYLHDGGVNYSGISFYNVQNGIIEYNVIPNNKHGIELNTSNYNVIDGNNCSINQQDGIYLLECDFNTIGNNSCWKNIWYGIYMDYCDNNTVEYNEVFSNSYDGIFIGISNYNVVEENTCLNNTWCGIHLEASSFNDIFNNNCSDNHINGISLWWNSNSNQIFLNVVINNTNYGAYVSLSASNIIWDNSFLENRGSTITYNPLTVQGYDDMMVGPNSWDLGGMGNYWYDWTSPDSDTNGIVDIPYMLDPDAGMADFFPLTTPVVIPEPTIFILISITLMLFLTTSRTHIKRK